MTERAPEFHPPQFFDKVEGKFGNAGFKEGLVSKRCAFTILSGGKDTISWTAPTWIPRMMADVSYLPSNAFYLCWEP